MKKVITFLTHQWTIKTIFFLIFMGSVVQLLRFESWARGGGEFVKRPEAVAGLLPVGHFTSFFAWIKGGGFDYLLPAGLIIIIAAIAVSLFFKRGFCGYICPLGTLMEAPALLGRTLMGKNIRLPKWLDLSGRGLQIAISLALLFWLAQVSLQEATMFRQLPYMWVADLKILHSFTNPIFGIALLIALLVSFLFSPLWCRYLCPVGGFYSLLGMASPCKVTRNEESCIDCKKCDHACDAFCDPSTKRTVHSNACDGCMECVKACPVENTLEARAFGVLKIDERVWPWLVVLLWAFIIGAAMALGLWFSTIPADTFKAVINSGLLEESTPLF